MDRVDNPEGEVTIGVVGKYVGLPDAYKALREALIHGGIANRVKVNIHWLDAEMFEHEDADLAAELEPMHGDARPRRVRRARQRRQDRQRPIRPRARRARSSASASACRWPASKARGTSPGSATHRPPNSAQTGEPVVGLITEWMSEEGLQKRAADGDLGGTMRLGAYPAKLDGNSACRRSTATDDQRAPPPSL